MTQSPIRPHATPSPSDRYFSAIVAADALEEGVTAETMRAAFAICERSIFSLSPGFKAGVLAAMTPGAAAS